MRFVKMQGIGNHFVVVDAADIPENTDLNALALRLCAPHFSIGADGLLVGEILGQDEPRVSMRMFNPDGTEDMCGNGLRCIGLWALAQGGVEVGIPFKVKTKEGIRDVEILEATADRRSGTLTIDMGAPRFCKPEIPFLDLVEPADLDRCVVQNDPLTIDGRTFRITSVNTGSTHTVIFGEPLTEEEFQLYSPQIELHPHFPERTSIMWATPVGENTVSIRIWERGAGETFGCGTGASAVGVAAKLQGIVARSEPVHVASRGGTLTIQWAGGSTPISMTGPAQTIYSGDIILD